MKLKNKSLIIFLSLALIGCANQNSNKADQSNNEVKQEESKEEEKVEQKETADTTEDQKEETTDQEAKHYDVNLAMLAGPTNAGAINMVEESKNGEGTFSFNESVDGAPDAVIPKIVSGEVDSAIIPPNLAAALYNKTQGKIKVLAINNLGVLYIVESPDMNINSLDDLVKSGETLYASAKGATPDIAIQEVLKANGYDEDDLKIEFLSEASEVAQKMIAKEAKVALLPEPMVTKVLMKLEGSKVAIDINDLYEKATGSPLISAVLVARSEYLDNIDADKLLETYKASIEKANSNVEGTAKLLGKYEIMPEEVAKNALPKLALKYIAGDEMKTMMEKHLKDLFEFNPKLVGGSLPEDDFYYTK